MGFFSSSWEKPPGWDDLYGSIMGQYRGGAPDWMRQAFESSAQQAAAGVRNWGAQNLPTGVASGNLLAAEMQARAKAMEGLPEEAGRYKMGLLASLQNLLNMQQYKPSTFERFGGGDLFKDIFSPTAGKLGQTLAEFLI